MKSSQSKLGEAQAIALLQKELERAPTGGATLVGIGDDAAVLGLRGKHVWSIDCSTEGVHFDLSWLSVGQAASRAFEAALSDLAAMGARPVAALCNLQIPSGATRQELQSVARAQRKSSARSACPMIGGNLAAGSCWQFTTTVLGVAPKPLLRAGAKPGDEIWLFGTVGEAGAGLSLLQAGVADAAGGLSKQALARHVGPKAAWQRAVKRCVRAWQQPHALIELGLAVAPAAHCGIDVSDGLASEAWHLAEAGEVALVLDAVRLRSIASEALKTVALEQRRDVLELQLYGGEDYALLATGAARKRPQSAKVVGLVEAGQGAQVVDHAVDPALHGAKRYAVRRGYDHLSAS